MSKTVRARTEALDQGWQIPHDRTVGPSPATVTLCFGDSGKGYVSNSRSASVPWITPGTLEALIPGRMQGHGGTEEVPDELRERAAKMVFEIREVDGKGHGEISRVARQLDVHPEGRRGPGCGRRKLTAEKCPGMMIS